jgi:hypothetical protein
MARHYEFKLRSDQVTANEDLIHYIDTEFEALSNPMKAQNWLTPKKELNMFYLLHGYSIKLVQIFYRKAGYSLRILEEPNGDSQ